MNKRNTDLSCMIRVEGINYKGFGTIPKAIMLDPELSVKSKAIYAYFASYAGTDEKDSGANWFPSVAGALNYLGISETTYYEHYNPLKEQGYIAVDQEFVNGRLVRNIYTLKDQPDKYWKEPSNPALAGLYSDVRRKGLLEARGYGTMPKSVATDTRLNIIAKALYAFFASFAGKSLKAFPKRDETVSYLKIACPTYGKYVDQLVEYNYITPSPRDESGRFCVTVYTLNPNPDETMATPKKKVATKRVAVKINRSNKGKPQLPPETPKPEETAAEKTIPAKKPDKIAISHRSQKTREQYPREQYSKEQKTREHIINSSVINPSITNPSINPAQARSDDGWTQETESMGVIPAAMKTVLSQWLYSCPSNDENASMKKNSELFSFALMGMCKNASVQRKIEEYITADGVSPVLGQIRSAVIKRVLEVSQREGIRSNPVKYMETSIWNALQLGELGVPTSEPVKSHHTSYDLDEFEEMMYEELLRDLEACDKKKTA